MGMYESVDTGYGWFWDIPEFALSH